MSGSTVDLGGRAHILRPLNVKALKAVGNRLHLLDDIGTAQGLDVLVDVLFYGIQRSDPSITRDFVETELEMADIPKAVEAIRAANGFVTKEAGSGEAQPDQ